MPRTSKAELRARGEAVIALLAQEYPEATCALIHDGPFQLLAATILSAQCTDARVNMVTPELFRRWPDPAALADADQEEVEEVIRTTGFFRNKAKNLIGMARGVMAEHGGEIPQDIDALVALPGVARKTANVVLGTAFGINVGVVVDTHVHRLAHRLWLSRQHDTNKVESDLMKLLPRDTWTDFSHRVILHGRRICSARRPRCGACSLRVHCPSRQDVDNPKKLHDKRSMTTPTRRRTTTRKKQAVRRPSGKTTGRAR